ncbi:prolactin-2C3-like [Mesocricetus auratus]|uniref:Prolactin-2C3-like n=1 Tax=Mesocricetus auratus TaxID=10036 RepID=A0A1U7Q3P5_MESAU|nr:prolactin-2C3-like [Mesocricetus auratus]
MQLCLTQPHSWTLLLLLSNLLLWDNVASVPMCAMRNGRCFVSLKDMFHIAGSLAREISQEVTGMVNEFKNHYAKVHGLQNTALTSCHTSSLRIPENKRQAMKTNYEVLLKSVATILGAWENPMQHLVKELSTLKEVPADVISKAKTIKEKDSGLFEGVKTLYNLVGNGKTENYPAWSGLPSLRSDNEDARILALYDMISCLNRDSKKIDIYLNILKCKISQLEKC